MSDEHRPDSPEARARERVRELPAPAADPAVRARLRRGFVAGTLAPSGIRAVPADPGARTRRGPTRLRWLAPLAAAAVLLVVLALNQPPAWRLAGVSGEGSVTIDGRRVAAVDHGALRRRLRPGARIVTGDDVELTLRGGGAMTLVAIPRTEFELPALPRRWLDRTGRGRVLMGEIRGVTGAAFSGTLNILTPEAHVQVTGTTFAVIRDSTGSCVCVLEGHVRIGPVGGELRAVGAERRRLIHRDGTVHEEPIPPPERMKLGMLRDQARAAGEPADATSR
jgi:ferric-dicitrate binding protein FerR (iron transport regulator)